MNYTIKHVYILFLLILVSLLVFIVQGLYQQETTYIKPVEFTRIDGHDEQLGKISEVLVRINNGGAISHNYTVRVFMNSVFITNETVEVMPDLPFSFSMTFPTERQYVNDTIIEEPVHNISFAVYRDDRIEPVDSIEYWFD